ncbi:hypothetical protein CPC08DRAFT_109341 [Agrocybe pediades]|nr:hypothetical protein CPC08DRAFT_109341 [Agrocybe pediades]
MTSRPDSSSFLSSSSLTMADTPSAVAQAMQEVEVIRYTRIVANVIIFYDYLVTLEEEVRLMWRGKWSLVKILFFVIRYYGLLGAIFSLYSILTPFLTNKVSMRIVQWDIITAFLATLLTEAVLIIRLYALYNRSRKLLTFMLLCYAATTSCSAWIMSQDIVAGIASIVVRLPGTATCTFPPLPQWAYAFWIPFTTFDTLLCAFALYRGYQTFASSVGLHGSLANRLLKVMIRDSLFNFIILSLAYLSGTLVWVKLSNAYILIPGAFIITLCNVLSNRMILNIRDTASKQGHVGTNPSSSTFIELSVFPLTPRENWIENHHGRMF